MYRVNIGDIIYMDDLAEIYVLGTARGPKKIRVSADAKRRARAVQSTSGQALRLLHHQSVPGESRREVEAHAHWLLRDRWVRGEWFTVTLPEAKTAIAESLVAVAEGRGQRSNKNLGRPRINGEQTPARFPDGTLARIDAACVEKENRSDFIREAVERELKRRGK